MAVLAVSGSLAELLAASSAVDMRWGWRALCLCLHYVLCGLCWAVRCVVGVQCRYVKDYLAVGEAPDQIRNCFQQRSRWCKVRYLRYNLSDDVLGVYVMMCGYLSASSSSDGE